MSPTRLTNRFLDGRTAIEFCDAPVALTRTISLELAMTDPGAPPSCGVSDSAPSQLPSERHSEIPGDVRPGFASTVIVFRSFPAVLNTLMRFWNPSSTAIVPDDIRHTL